MLQHYIKRSDLAAAAAAVNEVVQSGPAPPLRLTRTGYGAVEWADRGVLLYRVERSAQLLQLARRVVDALRPFSFPGGTAQAFARQLRHRPEAPLGLAALSPGAVSSRLPADVDGPGCIRSVASARHQVVWEMQLDQHSGLHFPLRALLISLL